MYLHYGGCTSDQVQNSGNDGIGRSKAPFGQSDAEERECVFVEEIVGRV